MACLVRSPRIAATLIAVFVCAALAAPAAFARLPADDPPPAALAAAGAPQQPVSRTVIQQVRDKAFYVGDAAVGAGTAAALILLVLGALASGAHPRVRFAHRKGGLA